jgi:MFS family permease
MDPFRFIPLWILAVGLLGILLGSVEVGRWGGRRSRTHHGADAARGMGTLLGAMFGLLGLVLAFTYSFVMTRSDLRKQAAIEEANAIGTAYLRAGLVDEPVRGELRAILREYARTRLITSEHVSTPKRLQETVTRSTAVQRRLWPAGARLLEGRQGGPIDALLLASLNQVYDMHTRRLAASLDRLPTVLVMLVFIASLSMCVAGFVDAAAGHHNRIGAAVLVVMLAIVILVIVDLDHPLSGLVQVSQESLRDLIRDMEAERAAAATP